MINLAASQSSVQESAHKRKADPYYNVKDNFKRLRMDLDDHEDSRKSIENVVDYSRENTYHKGGLVHSLHGNIYQLKLQMLFLKRALDRGYEFQLGTEVEDADKFDDIVFKYKNKDESGEDEICFVQVKHKQDESKKITANDLLKGKNDDLSLQKYFISYRKIMKSPHFSKCKLKQFILYTNIDFAYLGKASITIKRIEENNDILKVTKFGKATKRFKFIPKGNEIYEKLRQTSDLHVLVEALKQHILVNKQLQLIGILKRYHIVLSKNIFNILQKTKNDNGKEVTKKIAKFRHDFLYSNKLSEEVSNFRNTLQSALEFNDSEQLQKELSHKELSVSKRFGEVYEIQNNPTIADSKGLAKIFAQTIAEAQIKRHDIITIKPTRNSITANIHKLAFHILVQDESNENLIRFRNAFFYDNHKLKGNLEEFKAALKIELKILGIQFDALSEYKYEISEFYTYEETPEGALVLPMDKIPIDDIENAEIDEFLRKLVFAVNQPNEDELGEIITEEIGQSSEFNLLDAKLVSDSFQKKMLDWFKEKRPEKGNEGVWLNCNSGRMFLSTIKKQISSLISVGISVAYPEKLATYGIKFETNAIFQKLKAFLSHENSSKQIYHLIAPEETLLCTINVYSVLEDLKKQTTFAPYKKCDSYIFVRLSTLLRVEAQTYIIDAFKSKDNHNLLIVDAKSSAPESDIRRLYKKLADILLIPCKKIILIATKHNILINRFTEDFESKVEDATYNTNFVDLTEESQRKLLQNKIIFQGQAVRFNSLIDRSDKKVNEIIDVETIVKLIKNNKIRISRKLKGLGDVDYIIRWLRKVTFIKDKIQECLNNKSLLDLFVINGSGSGLKHNNIYEFDEAKSGEHKFNELCNQNTESNIHWLECESKNITWYKSHGSIANLIQYRIREIVHESVHDNNTRSIINNSNNSSGTILPKEHVKLLHQIDHHKIVIISNSAGMGKSTVLTHLSTELKEKCRSLWVIRINLNDHTKLLSKMVNKRKLELVDHNINKVVDFISNNLLALQKRSQLEKRLFVNSFNNGKIALLFDGFDEISPDYKDVIIDLLKSLKKSNFEKIFVTTRPNLREELERALEVFSHALEPFSKENQTEYLTKYWTKKLKLKDLEQIYTIRLTTYAESIIKHISKSNNDTEEDFIGIPLQTMMLAEVFQENQQDISSVWQGCKEFLKSDLNKPILPSDCALLDLYERFIKRKFQIYLEEKKKRDLTKVGEPKSADIEFKVFKEIHALLALQTLFSKETLKQLLSSVKIKELETLIEEIKKYEHNNGIVVQIIDNKPLFIHKTFAEYFASFIIADKMISAPAETLRCIDNVLLNISAIFIINIIEQLDGKQEKITISLKQPLLHFVVIENHANFIKSLLKYDYNDWPNKLDAYGKTPLHYAIEHGHFNIIKNKLYFADDIQETSILNHSAFRNPEHENSKLVKFINIQDKSENTALYYAVQKNHLHFAFELLLKGASIDSLTDVDVNILIQWMLHGRSSNDNLYYNGILGAYADQDNKYRPIQEKLFLKAPGIFKELCEKDQSRILSYFFVYGRVKVIDALLRTIHDVDQRKQILNNCDNSSTPLDRVNYSDQLSDDDRLEITKYLFERGGTKSNQNEYRDRNSYDHRYNGITQILLAAAKSNSIKTFQYFITQEKHDNYYLHFYQACANNQRTIINYLMENHKEIINYRGNTPLHTACDSGANLQIIKYLIDHGDINAKNDNSQTPLFMAIHHGNGLDIIEYLVTKGSNIDWEDKNGDTLLSLAVMYDKKSLIDYLLQKNACISEKVSQIIKDKVAFYKELHQNRKGLIVESDSFRLHTAIRTGNCELAKLFIKYGNDINEVDAEGNSPLHLASARNDVEIPELLLQYGAIFDKKNINNKTPRDLCRCDKIGWLLMVLNKLFNSKNLLADLNKYILKKKPNEDLKNWGPYGTGYPDASEKDNPMLFILNARNFQGQTLLHIAAADMNGTEVMSILFKYNCEYLNSRYENFVRHQDYQSISVNIMDSQGNTPLHIAAQKGHYYIVSRLLEARAIFNSMNNQGDTPELLALNNNHNNIVEMLQKIRNLFIAIEKNNYNILEVKNSINKVFINAKNESGKTLLHLAASCGQVVVVQLLLDNGADVESFDLNKNTPLHIAAEKNEIKIIKLLLKSSPSSSRSANKYRVIYNEINTQDRSPLDLAHGDSHNLLGQIDKLFKDIQSDTPHLVIEDLKIMDDNYGLDVCINVRDNKGNTLLHYAVVTDLNIVELLLQNGACFDARNKFKQKPQDVTTDQKIINLLKAIEGTFNYVFNVYKEQKTVSNKIITNVRDCTGKTLLHYAVDRKIVEFLVKNGANVNLMDIDYSLNMSSPLEKEKIIKYLIDNGDIYATNYKLETPLLMAIYSRCELNVIQYLVDKGSNINCADLFCNTPLSCAVENNQVDIVRYLISKGAHVSEKISQLLKDKNIDFES